jgi:DNA-binding NarL/FixJ family response regulator
MSRLNKNRIIIIDPSPVIRFGLKKMLEENAEFTITAMYNDLQAFREIPGEKQLDILIINPSIINIYRRFVVRDLLPEYGEMAIVAIQYGYVDGETLASFDGALNIYDESLKMRRKLKQICQDFVRDDRQPADNIDLSDREKEILVSVARGLTNKEIADKHCISVHTVISHRKNISRKTGISTVAGLTVYAVFNNLVSQDELMWDN